jgi:aryl-alcohol dehydrogenase-like predicted oxidoreductase
MTSTIATRTIGSSSIGCLGFGAMGLAAFYGKGSDQKVVNEILSECIKKGVTMIDTSDFYSPMELKRLGYNEEQIGTFLKEHPGAREKLFIATKFTISFDDKGNMNIDGSRDYCLSACDASLKRLGIDQIDLYYAHRVDPKVDVTETVGALKELQDAGKIKYIGVSEYNVEQLTAANKVAHIDALQIEFSPWTPEVLTNGILKWCEDNGTTLVAYSPLGRGFLTGQYKSLDDFEEGDFRRFNPRFEGENFKKNLVLVDDIKKIADKKGVTPGQIALAWVSSKSKSIVPIPGTKKVKYLQENIEAANIKLDAEEIKEIDSVINSFQISGTRYAPAMMGNIAF